MSETEVLIYGLVFIGVIMFIMVGVEILGKSWQSYEEKYVEGAESTLDSMFITIPPQVILYVGLACGAFAGALILFLFENFILSFIVSIVSFFIPQVYVKFLKIKRDKDFGIQLVDALSSMGNALKAGLSLPQSIDLIQREMANPISQEFRLVFHEVKFGLTMDQAFVNLQKRMPNDDLELMSTAINVSQEVGGNLSEIFENISNTIRARHQSEQKIKALTAMGKMQGIVLCLMPVALLGILTVIQPDLMAPMYSTILGIAILVAATIMLMLGAFFISRIIAINV